MNHEGSILIRRRIITYVLICSIGVGILLSNTSKVTAASNNKKITIKQYIELLLKEIDASKAQSKNKKKDDKNINNTNVDNTNKQQEIKHTDLDSLPKDNKDKEETENHQENQSYQNTGDNQTNPNNQSESQLESYIEQALKKGLLKNEKEFKFSKQLTRTECAVLTNRADIYLHGDEVKKIYDNITKLKRISDLSKVKKAYRDDVVQVFGKGIIVGYSNGKCTQERQFRGSKKISYSGAKDIINKLINIKKRSIMSPDGQLTRTTNLPCNAKEFDYILASFPNKFYEMKFYYELGKKSHKPKFMVDYVTPVEFKNKPTYKGTIIQRREMLDKYLYYWCDIVKKNLLYLLNVNYKTIGDKWAKNLNSTLHFDSMSEIKKYIKNMKKNKVIIKSSIVSVEPSTLYYGLGTYLRVYVKFKVTSAKNISDNVIYGDIYMPKLKINEWHEGYYDIQINGYTNGDGSEYLVSKDRLNDFWGSQYKNKILKPAFNKRGDEDFPDGFYYFK